MGRLFSNEVDSVLFLIYTISMGIEIPKPIEFEWDSGNKDKSYLKHEVTTKEAEQVFLNKKKRSIFLRDKKHSIPEKRYIIIGQDYEGRLLTIAFIIRKKRIRVISARPAAKKERLNYEKKAEKKARSSKV